MKFKKLYTKHRRKIKKVLPLSIIALSFFYPDYALQLILTAILLKNK